MYYNWNHREKLPDLIRRNDFTYFEILDNNGKINYTSINETSDTVADELQEQVNNIETGEFTIIVYPDRKKKLGSQQIFKYKNQTTNNNNSISGISQREYELSLQNARLKWEQELQQSENQNEQINPFVAGLQTFDMFLEKWEPRIKPYIGNKQTGVNGLPSELEQIDKIIQSTGFANQIYSALLARLKSNTAETLRKLQTALS